MDALSRPGVIRGERKGTRETSPLSFPFRARLAPSCLIFPRRAAVLSRELGSSFDVGRRGIPGAQGSIPGEQSRDTSATGAAHNRILRHHPFIVIRVENLSEANLGKSAEENQTTAPLSALRELLVPTEAAVHYSAAGIIARNPGKAGIRQDLMEARLPPAVVSRGDLGTRAGISTQSQAESEGTCHRTCRVCRLNMLYYNWAIISKGLKIVLLCSRTRERTSSRRCEYCRRPPRNSVIYYHIRSRKHLINVSWDIRRAEYNIAGGTSLRIGPCVRRLKNVGRDQSLNGITSGFPWADR
uniref:Uncharacterized protein n=1 Tax=Branchiostoma floridae TaxID=7739 RepID=C3Z1S4_BRAFL|eukprot:XP_002597429.1 hypothetical protein BRAFLDRAFT_80566 [Branchiostoma floridae]